jgi:SAM-dependent methyltransferase
MANYYVRWSEADCVRSFSEKRAQDFFESERQLLHPIIHEITSVLDVGCASGRYADLLATLDPTIEGRLDFHGIDISEASVASARESYPQYRFEMANALDYAPPCRFDLVNAIGVLQHEPRFDILIGRMLEWASKYVLFDVKLARVPDHLVDISRAYAGSAENRLYFNLLNYERFLADLLRTPDIDAIRIYGYPTPINARTVVPVAIPEVVSAAVLLHKGACDGQPKIEAQLPVTRLSGLGPVA